MEAILKFLLITNVSHASVALRYELRYELQCTDESCVV